MDGLRTVVGAAVITCLAAQVQGAEVSENISLGGFGMAHYSQTDKEDDHGTFEFHPIYINLWARPQERLNLVVEIEYEHLPKQTDGEDEGEIKTSQAHVRYDLLDDLSLSVGQFCTHAGIWMPIHWRVLQSTYARPTFYENANKMFPSRQVGLSLTGEIVPEDVPVAVSASGWWTLGADDYGSNRADTEFNNFGGDLRVTGWDIVTVGGSYNEVNATADFTHDQDAFMAYGQVSLFSGRLKLATEYVGAEWTPQHGNTNTYADMDALYVSASYEVYQGVELYVRHEVGDDLKRTGNSEPLASADLSTDIDTAAVTWNVTDSTEISLEYSFIRFGDGEDYDKVQISLGQIF